jgi:hypothetical protein
MKESNRATKLLGGKYYNETPATHSQLNHHSDSPFSGVSPGACGDAGPANEKYCGSENYIGIRPQRPE